MNDNKYNTTNKFIVLNITYIVQCIIVYNNTIISENNPILYD